MLVSGVGSAYLGVSRIKHDVHITPREVPHKGPKSSLSVSLGHPQNLLSLPVSRSFLGRVSDLSPTIPIYCFKTLGRFTGGNGVASFKAG